MNGAAGNRATKMGKPGGRVSASERVNTTLSGSGRIDDFKSHPQGALRGQTKLVKITEDVEKYAAERAIAGNKALQSGLKAKATEFAEKRSKVYAAG